MARTIAPVVVLPIVGAFWWQSNRDAGRGAGPLRPPAELPHQPLGQRAEVRQADREPRRRRPAGARTQRGARRGAGCRPRRNRPSRHSHAPLRAQLPDPSNKTGLQISFTFRSRPKQFYFASEQACQSAFGEISAWLRQADRTPVRGRMTSAGDAAPSPTIPPRLAPLQIPGPATPTDPVIPSPRDFSGKRAWAWACLRHTAAHHCLEVSFFGVMMPVAVGSYFFSRIMFEIISRSGRWLAALCVVEQETTLSEHLFHDGKYFDAKDIGYERGWKWRLEVPPLLPPPPPSPAPVPRLALTTVRAAGLERLRLLARPLDVGRVQDDAAPRRRQSGRRGEGYPVVCGACVAGAQRPRPNA